MDKIIKNPNPKISILIPNKDNRRLLASCIESILKLTTYDNYEIVIIENNSTDSETFMLYDKLITEYSGVRILYYPDTGFNYQKIMNYGAEHTDSDYILHLNNDTKLLTPNWLELMLAVAKNEDTGAVGAKLYYPDMSIQHIGGTLYLKDKQKLVNEHMFLHLSKDKQDKTEILSKVRTVAFVTGACLFVQRKIYQEAGGMDEEFTVDFGDVDLCMKIRALGKKIIIHPQVELLHYECLSRGYYLTKEKLRRYRAEQDYFIMKWRNVLSDTDQYDTESLHNNMREEIRKGNIMFSAQKILEKILPLSIYIHFYNFGAERYHRNLNRSIYDGSRE